ncbi:hypothetical protein CANARDRAFT_26751 [[Candida] arabinofermentans NRRL YB-2248]|uniref:serine C-palmitoyltransferase n=1 Tax=[Candida] arabinofermentans NRRL YB-2248 TaxID=983967 RepID=A0A1E4T6Q3_9ASCO|nr:hypothetical protein CANARDRAFT_26751 [[Candida] arabinofermentans NRRL YB-2248]
MDTVTTTVTKETSNQAPQFVIKYASSAVELWYGFISFIETIPGGQIIINYIKASHKNDPWRTLLELLLALLAIRYFLASKYSQDESEKVKLSKREVDELIDDWEPEPIVPAVRQEERWLFDAIPAIEGAITKHVNVVEPKSKEIIYDVLNMAGRDFLDMNTNELVKSSAIKTITECGVGACGPANFYGTQDVHVRASEDLARFLGAEKGIVYGQDFCTATSVLPCFLKRGDIAIVDDGVSLSLQKAVMISRCSIEWFHHNDMDHLESILESLQEELQDGPLNRRFIVTEGLFENFGDSPDLARLVEIKNKYKFRLALDESYSIGTLGPNGRGLPEAYGIPRTEIEMTIGTLANSFGSSGGFCVGCDAMIYHQILSSNAYVFSAYIPPYCASATSAVINLLEASEKPGEINPLVKPLQENIALMSSLFRNSSKLADLVSVRSSDASAVMHIRINPALRKSLDLPEGYGGPGSQIVKAVKNGHETDYFDREYNTECYILQLIIDQLLNSKVLLTRSKRILHHEVLPCVPELIIYLNSGFTKSEIQSSFIAIEDAIYQNLSTLTYKSFDQISDSLEFS